MLGRTADAVVVHEPDNETCQPFALRAKAILGRFPVLGPTSLAPHEYGDLWERAFWGWRNTNTMRHTTARVLLKASGSDLEEAFDVATRRMSSRLHIVSSLAAPPARPSPEPQVIVKSVHAALALRWLTRWWDPKVVIVVRDPMNVVASHLELGWSDSALDTHPLIQHGFVRAPTLPEDASPVTRLAWQVGVFASALREAAERDPAHIVVSHEALCRDPETGLRDLCEALDLPWTGHMAQFVAESNKSGTGFDTNRVATEQQPDRWRDRLTPEQQRDALEILDLFPAAIPISTRRHRATRLLPSA